MSDGESGESAPTTEDDRLPSLEEVRGDVGKTPANPRRAERFWNRRFRAVSIRSEAAFEHLTGLRDHYGHRRKWSYFLMGTMGGLLGFQSLLLLMVGFGFWDFTAYEWLLPALMVQNLAAIIGLAYVVVRALFKDVDRPKEFEEMPTEDEE
jgi:hypothetical protein